MIANKHETSKEKLAGSQIISAIEISDERIFRNRGYFRARLTLINSDRNPVSG